MVEIGKYNNLTINRFVEFGAYLDAGDLGEILIPLKYIPEDVDVDDEIEVFVHLDGEERYIATTEDVYAQVGEVAYMEVVAISEHGAFVDWGLVKNLFVPFREQNSKFRLGDKRLIFVYLDELTYRIAGSERIMKHIPHDLEGLHEKDEVNIIIWRETPSGYLAVIEDQCIGMIYQNQIFKAINIGDRKTAYIKKIRDDQKIDLLLQKEGYENVEDFSETLEKYLIENGDVELNDKSTPELINAKFGVSKKIFKKAVGKLYKEKKILIMAEGIKYLNHE